MTALGREIYGRIAALLTAAQLLVANLADQFDKAKSVANGQKEFLHGVIEFYQARLNTQTTVAAERPAGTPA
jgi:magnesium transporter